MKNKTQRTPPKGRGLGFDYFAIIAIFIGATIASQFWLAEYEWFFHGGGMGTLFFLPAILFAGLLAIAALVVPTLAIYFLGRRFLRTTWGRVLLVSLLVGIQFVGTTTVSTSWLPLSTFVQEQKQTENNEKRLRQALHDDLVQKLASTKHINDCAVFPLDLEADAIMSDVYNRSYWRACVARHMKSPEDRVSCRTQAGKNTDEALRTIEEQYCDTAPIQ